MLAKIIISSDTKVPDVDRQGGVRSEYRVCGEPAAAVLPSVTWLCG